MDGSWKTSYVLHLLRKGGVLLVVHNAGSTLHNAGSTLLLLLLPGLLLLTPKSGKFSTQRLHHSVHLSGAPFMTCRHVQLHVLSSRQPAGVFAFLLIVHFHIECGRKAETRGRRGWTELSGSAEAWLTRSRCCDALPCNRANQARFELKVDFTGLKALPQS